MGEKTFSLPHSLDSIFPGKLHRNHSADFQENCCMKKQIGLVGYGKMGKEIFNLLAKRGCPTTVFVRGEDKAAQAKKRIDRSLERSRRKGIMTEEQFRKQRASLQFTNRLEDLASSQLVIESIVENWQQKMIILQQIEAIVSPSTVLVTNTSSFSIARLAEQLTRENRFCGLHLFYPVPLIDVVEIIRWSGTSMRVITLLSEFCTYLGKTPLIVKDAPGSVLNGILADYYIEALYILEQGVALPSKIDQVARQFFYVGPCESLDIIGMDFFIEALQHSRYEARRPERQIPDLAYKLVTQKRRGKKDSQGIFLYHSGKMVDDDLAFYRNPAQTHSRQATGDNDSWLAKRLLYAIFYGAIYSLTMGFASLETLDVGVKALLDMKQGPFSILKAIGVEKFHQESDQLTRQVGNRFGQTDVVHFLSSMFSDEAQPS
ncbi:hypothetical protein GF339_00895 [candidate division KSB3 bacterium]|uniref:3-hydroxyacyl-CoA dehydrogenase n=1 Tax=candidate division KSB3 bacterium TaxID=2044937 RepID=A0A9D5JSD3_9BACT|nr:hypothetical protein [candidate division KSB3 bacterium]MBD3323106.1 hypothetical protein [candidate division KSB3 bacterium]